MLRSSRQAAAIVGASPEDSSTGRWGDDDSPAPSRPAPKLPRKKRWGLRTMGCCLLVITAMVVSIVQGYHTPGTLGCAVLGFGGAIYCTIRGLQDLIGLEWYRRRLAERREYE